MTHYLHQDIGFKTQRTFLLKKEGVSVHITEGFIDVEYVVPFEHISTEFQTVTRPFKRDNNYIAGLAFSFLIAIPLIKILKTLATNTAELGAAISNSLVLLLIGGCWLIYYFNRKQKYRKSYLVFTPTGVKELALIKDSPSDAEVRDFIKTMIDARNRYLQDKYPIPIEPFESESLSVELQRFFLLKEQGAISEEEFDKIREDLLKGVVTDKKPPGFIN